MKKITLFLTTYSFRWLAIALCVGGLLTTNLCSAQYSILHNFNDTLGKYPAGSLTLLRNRLYGMTSIGGANKKGNIFSLDTNGSGYKDIFDFNGINGAAPFGALILCRNKFYGMVSDGGTHNFGVIFSIDTNGTNYTDLYDFTGTTGANPNGSLILVNKTLYGLTDSGGTNNMGVIFSIDTNGSNYTDMFDFNGANGGNPYGDLTHCGNKLWGLTAYGGANSFGNIFYININGSGFKDVLDFDGSNAFWTFGTLALSSNKLYGISAFGGVYGDGIIFSIDSSGNNFKDIYDINLVPIVVYSINTYVSLSITGKTMYAFITYGGPNGNGDGNLIRIDTNGNNYKDLFDFNGTNGLWPEGTPALSGNKLFGVANEGGTYNNGIVFSFTDTTLIPTSFNNLISSDNVSLYPNPSNGVFTIEVSSEKLKVNTVVEIFNMLGQQVYMSSFGGGVRRTEEELDLSSQPSGIYLYRVISGDGKQIANGKFIINK